MNDTFASSKANQAFVDSLKANKAFRTESVEAAFRAVPRHLFLPGVPLDVVYRDDGIPTKMSNGVGISASSQPSLMAAMLEWLALSPGHRVLEIGAGTGYNAGLMAHLVGPTGRIFTLDIDEDIVEQARMHVATASITNVEVLQRDGNEGYPEAAPYDRIILTVGAWDVPGTWFQQLVPGGRLIIPLGIRTDMLTFAFERLDDHLVSVAAFPGFFMPMRGTQSEASQVQIVALNEGLQVQVGMGRFTDINLELFEDTYQDFSTPIVLDGSFEQKHNLFRWVALRDQRAALVYVTGDWAPRAIVPFFWGKDGEQYTGVGLIDHSCAALLGRILPREAKTDYGLFVRSFGSDDGLAYELIDHVMRWQAAGKPSLVAPSTRLYPNDVTFTLAANEIDIPYPSAHLVVRYEIERQND
jgi:protein-L-isoaspartate(D-aspartate) O-methyltransferase